MKRVRRQGTLRLPLRSAQTSPEMTKCHVGAKLTGVRNERVLGALIQKKSANVEETISLLE